MASEIRLYISKTLRAGVEVTLTEKQYHYLYHVMRRSLGDEVLLFNGQDGEWCGALEFFDKNSGCIVISSQIREQHSEPNLWLVFSLLKRNPTDLVVEKASELGVSKLCPVITSRTNSTKVNIERLRAIAIEAAEQCGRLSVPEICQPERLEQLLSNWPEGRSLVLLDESGAGNAIAEVMAERVKKNGDAVLIGPEGGFEPAELEYIRALPFVTPVSLGRRLLRAETAAVAALATWQALSGDWARGSKMN
jgi:16S rRNA (uracil1498-N3)-methyltransferase